jgi:predicted RNA methylase
MQSDMDVRVWADYYSSLIERHSNIRVRTITDLGCGTGSVDIRLA